VDESRAGASRTARRQRDLDEVSENSETRRDRDNAGGEMSRDETRRETTTLRGVTKAGSRGGTRASLKRSRVGTRR